MPNRIEAVEEKEPAKKSWQTPASLLTANKVLRLMAPLSRKDQVNVVNIVLTHFALNEPLPPTPEPTGKG